MGYIRRSWPDSPYDTAQETMKDMVGAVWVVVVLFVLCPLFFPYAIIWDYIALRHKAAEGKNGRPLQGEAWISCCAIMFDMMLLVFIVTGAEFPAVLAALVFREACAYAATFYEWFDVFHT